MIPGLTMFRLIDQRESVGAPHARYNALARLLVPFMDTAEFDAPGRCFT